MIQKEVLAYQDPLSGQNFEGVICWDDSTLGPMPGILVAHTFKGQTDFETEKAMALAEMGYVGFALDMYGKDKRATTPEAADALMQPFLEDRALLLRHITLAYETLCAHEKVNADKVGGIGFCFGGKCMLDLARSGADICGVVSFHGIYDQPGLATKGDITASILVLHGWEDPLAKPESMVALGHELTQRKADWQILALGHTGHSFTNPKANFHDRGMFYQKTSNDRAWLSMQNFFQEML